MKNSPLKIMFVIPGQETGSSMIFCKRQVNSLQQLGLTTATFFLNSRTNPLLIGKDFWRFIKLCKKFSPRLIHVYFGTVTSFFTALASLILRIPMVITFLGSDINNTAHVDGFWRDLLGRVLSQLSILRATQVICVSPFLKRKMWWQRNKALVFTMGINTQLFSPTSVEEARAILRWDHKEKIVLFNAGKSPAIKRLDLAMQVIKEVQKSVADSRMEILTGELPYEKIPLYFNASDCLLVTSDTEGSPTIIKEAMACNLPIVSVEVGDVKLQIQQSSHSFIIEREVGLLAKQVVSVLQNKERSNGREFSYFFSEENIAKEIINIYSPIN